MHSIVFFDLDGTLTDPAEGITACIRHALVALGAKVPSQTRLVDCIGPPLQESFSELLGTNDLSILELAQAKYRERFERVGMFENRVYEGIPEALSEIRARGYQLCVATSKPHVYARKILDHFGLSQHFDHIFGPELDGTRREKTKLLAHALKVTQTRASRCLMVGDRKHDIMGARDNAIAALAVTWGYGSRVELEAAGADGFVSAVGELVEACAALHPAGRGSGD